VWAALLARGTFNTLLTYVIFVGWIFYGLGAAALLFRRTMPDAPRVVQGALYPSHAAALRAGGDRAGHQHGGDQSHAEAIGIGGALLERPIYYLWRRPGERRGSGGGPVVPVA
jgi:hypothetical protein